MTDAFGYANGRKAIADHVDDDQKDSVTIRDAASGGSQSTIISEGGLNALVIGSRLPDVKPLERWIEVSHERDRQRVRL